MHLVCSNKGPESSGMNGPSGEESANQATPTEAPTQRTSPDTQMNGNFINTNLNFNAMPNAGFPMAMTPELIQQMAIMQQMYAQFVNQYQMQSGLDPQLSFPLTAQAPDNSIPPQPARVDDVPAEPPVAVPRNAVPDRGAAIVDDDDEQNRDWLDWFYWLSRAIVLFSIVYFYSSFSRFLVVVALGFTMYLYQIGWLFPRERNPLPNPNPAAAEPLARLQANEGDADAQRIQEMMDGNIDRPIRRDEPEETERFSGLRMFWVIVTSLFTSLIPEQVPANI